MITGTSGNDTLTGTIDDDIIEGLEGADVIDGGSGNDDLRGGDGDDTIIGGAGNDKIDGGYGNDALTGGDNFDVIYAGAGDDLVDGGDGDDYIFSYDRLDHVGGGSDILRGGSGNDRIYFYTDNDYGAEIVLDGGDGNDVIILADKYGIYQGMSGNHIAVLCGSGDDIVETDGRVNGVNISLGDGRDIFNVSSNILIFSEFSEIVLTDFETGLDGDQVNLDRAVGALINWDRLANPFSTGHMRLIQNGADALLQVDRDGGGDAYITLATFENSSASAFEGFNLGGFSADGSPFVGQLITGTDGGDNLEGGKGSDTIIGLGGADKLYGLYGNDELLGGDGNDVIYGDWGDDRIEGGAGDDTLCGEEGSDTVLGGDGDDAIMDGAGAGVIVSGGGSDILFGGNGNDRITVDRQINHGASIVQIYGEDGNDEIRISTVYSNRLPKTQFIIDGGAGSDEVVFHGIGYEAKITLGSGQDILTVQTLQSFPNTTRYVTDFESGDSGDRLQWSVPAYLEHLPDNWTDDPFATGYLRLIQSGANTIIRADLNGGGDNFVDFLVLQNVDASSLTTFNLGGFTPPPVITWPVVDVVAPASVGEGDAVDFALSFTFTGDAAAISGWCYISSAGTALPVGDFTIPSTATYFSVGPDAVGAYVHNLGRLTILDDMLAEGTETIAVTIRLGAGAIFANGTDTMVVTLPVLDNDFAGTAASETISGSDRNDTIMGLDGADTLNGLGGDDVLDGGAGIDTLAGGAGNDTYHVDAVGDRVIEAADGGNDRLFASVSYALGAGVSVETMTAAAGTASISLLGNELANILNGNDGANTLDGRGGLDTLAGGAGNDTYHVDAVGDRVIEAANGGNDRLFASVSYQLGAGVSVETMTAAAGTASISLIGNELANILNGNDGANTLNGLGGDDVLDGGAGIDTLAGGTGNDTYYVDAVGDRVIEAADGGNDRLFASVSYQLGAGVSVETMTAAAGTASISLLGNELANILNGNDGANTLDGRGGLDTLAGGAGNDTYYVDAVGDRIIEAANGGNDRLFASVSYQLGAGVSVETMTTAAGTAAINLTGNELANILNGNDGANTLDGRGGLDTLVGGAGNDTFRFSTALGAGNVDTIKDFSAADDRIALDDAIFGGLAMGILSPDAFVTGAAATAADDRIIYNAQTGALLFDADGAGGLAAIQFASLATGLTDLSANDFLVY